MNKNPMEGLSPEVKLLSLGVSPEIVSDKVTRLRNSLDLASLKSNIRETSLSIPQFLSSLFSNLYQQAHVKQRVTQKLKDFNLTPEMLDYLFIDGAGEPFLLFFGKYQGQSEVLDKSFEQAVNDVMLQELRIYLFE